MSINEKFQEAVNQQVVAEHQASLIYTQLSYEMDRLSFLGMRDWFRAQADEEREHAAKFASHLLDRDARVDLTDIDLPSLKIATPLDAFETALNHEQKISEMIRNLARTADETGDIDSRQLINFFLAEQIEEESAVNDIIDWIKTVGNDGSGLLRIDAKLGARDGE
jgi:ferritin